MNIQNIPLYQALITEEDDGIFNVSLVDCPAVLSDFLAFSKQTPMQQFAVTDEDQHIITGVIMRADFPIYRNDNGYEYYLTFSKETIKQMATKLLSDNLQNSINIMHMENSNVDGVQMLEIFIKDSSKGVCPTAFSEIEEGSLFATYKVNNQEVWNKIKDGTFRGFSLEGYFNIQKMNITEKMTQALVSMGSVETDKGTLVWVSEGDLEVGMEVYITVEDEKQPAADGDYATEEKIYSVLEGKVVEVTEKEAEEPIAQKDPIQEEPAQMAEEEPVVEEPVVEEPVQDEPKVSVEDFQALLETVTNLQAIVDELKLSVEAIQAELSKPVAEPIAEEFAVVTKPAVTSKAASKIGLLRK